MACTSFLLNSSLRPRLGVDFTFASWDNNDNNNNPYLNFLKGALLGDKDQGVGVMYNEG